MGNKQIYFSLGVGVFMTILGFWALAFSEAGLAMAITGLGLMGTSLCMKLLSARARKEHSISFQLNTGLKQPYSNGSRPNTGMRDAA